jgi:two-component system heavy metal sensor histidine kinase CusS
MKLRSFRLRIALLSAVLAGTALIGFGAIAWHLIYVAKLNRLDARLENQMARVARPRSLEGWQEFAVTLPRALGMDADTPTALLVLGADGDQLQAGDWPVDFDIKPLFPPRPNVPVAPSSPSEPRPDGSPSDFFRFRRERSPNQRLLFPRPAVRLLTLNTPTGGWRISLASFPNSSVAIAVSLQAIDQEMAAIQNIFLVAIPGTLLLVAGGAWLLAGSALHPIRELTSAMQRVTVTGLDQRLEINTDLEFVELIQVFNQMLERLERSFKQASRFSADAAHELKTPLAILQGELEQALQQADPGSEAQQQLSELLDEVRRLSGIVRKLLLLSLADAGQISFQKQNVNLSEMLVEMLEDMELLAPDLTVKTEIIPNLQVWGDHDLIMQILQNLLSNAIKYNLPDGWIDIQAQQQGSTVQVKISNASRDISEGARDRLFDRFYRGDPARNRKVEGVGLGLSLSREIARAHQGDLTLDVVAPGQTTFVLILPTRIR